MTNRAAAITADPGLGQPPRRTGAMIRDPSRLTSNPAAQCGRRLIASDWASTVGVDPAAKRRA